MKIKILALSFLVSVSQVIFSQTPPPEPEIFSPGFVSTPLPERDMAISPNGNEMFFTISSPLSTFQTIVYSRRNKSGKWSRPQVAPFCGHFSDLEPAFSFDGNRLFFSSNRPIEGNEKKDFDIWVVSKTNGVWGNPVNLGWPVNTNSDEFYPSITKSGNLYFTASRETGIGEEDIFVSQFVSGKYQQPVPLDTTVNSRSFEFNAFVSTDEKYIIYTACGRKDGKGGCDLYLSEYKDGKWSASKNLEKINSSRIDYCPFVSFDGKTLYFTSERHDMKPVYINERATIDGLRKVNNSILNAKGNIYWVDFQTILK
jgi:Tol biopolymer transport system component